MSGADIEHVLVEIGLMDLEQLREFWRRRYGAPPPPLRSVPIMRMQLAWRVQAEAFGGLDQDTRRAFARSGSVEAEGKHLGIGARLTGPGNVDGSRS